ncbi:transposase, partial [Actinomadura latina]|uniref:transposase n=1 Tax=Actinomadura latina TaxID=163603 RepID=UPI000A601FB8
KSKDGRSLTLHPQDAILRQARAGWATDPDLRDTYRQHRPMVERSIVWLIGPHGRARKLRHRGTTNGDLWLHLRLAGLNLRRLLNLGLTHTGQGWILA